MLFLQSFGILFVLKILLNASTMHSDLYSNIIWTASIGSSSDPKAFPFPSSPFAYLPHLMRNVMKMGKPTKKTSVTEYSREFR